MLNKDSFSDVQTQLRVTVRKMPSKECHSMQSGHHLYKYENIIKVMSVTLSFDSAETWDKKFYCLISA